MPGLETAREILSRERELLSLYRRLDSQVTDRDLNEIVDQLIRCQGNQIDMLNELIDELEPVPPPPTVNLAQHVVQPGETLFLIAQKYGTTVANLLRVNPDIEDPDEIEAGMIINLPILLPSPPDCFFRYTVEEGDTLFELAQRFNTTVNELVFYNSIRNPDLIFPGRILIIPCPEPGEGDLDFETIAQDNTINFTGSVEDRLFGAVSRRQLRRRLDSFDIPVPRGIDFNDNIVIGGIEYDIDELSLADDMVIRAEVERKRRGYHLIEVPKEQLPEEGTYMLEFASDGVTLDEDRIRIRF
ncbi:MULTISPECIES: LysM peptidoglycan-binding domain-containing protein [unclassified Candidatus Frackibacter]|uniref:LysM peptidoglycan-binding domain-containing protein n=1 Tax=unclassified Candidatus Frackibacter TaxID=2648818 RepID=UPI000888DB57|nr:MULTISPECIES: LysM domain-containing protein [unclassified Candidatus Frackibacter]SDC51516.1 LysM repeat-containing protein [Candidatus Frackibacter sp. WG11]SEM40996.1 LysM repeat-containing protein [Candidatus Frackibacter sp. WG12]SFL75541.1 LysM repeat-containing protein [Candidatus Frackibacter sp. WG13]